ncbi:tumor necrosis factor receptor superfamily member 5-like [Chelmon rostratus]|uniref:tumor necrosis factor receptor superfamily member 5-like n=1 Tax=Chelmon rostratus TaxID=109905 RepID=UPI001BE5F9ED|nr:tumor necrosis factor receptor superfamily member 5-like [Chelmon rostratus]
MLNRPLLGEVCTKPTALPLMRTKPRFHKAQLAARQRGQLGADLSVSCSALLSGVLCDALVDESVPTNERQDPSTGETLICAKCTPGTHMAAHCTATTATGCVPCKGELYTELWNYLPRCLYCNNFCYENQEVEKECTAVSNRVCRCKEGFCWADKFCVRHTECGPGHGDQMKGTSQSNTVCEECAEGFFSNSSSALDSCVNHQECASRQIVLLPGSIYHDTMCGTCEGLANGVEMSRAFLSGFFSMHRMRVAKVCIINLVQPPPVLQYKHEIGTPRDPPPGPLEVPGRQLGNGCSLLINIGLAPPPTPPPATPHRPGIASAPWLSHHARGGAPLSTIGWCCKTDGFTHTVSEPVQSREEMRADPRGYIVRTLREEERSM